MRLGRLGIFEFITSLIALYVCVGTTPLGELTKRTFAWATGWEIQQRPLSSYFSGADVVTAEMPSRPFSQMHGLREKFQKSSRGTNLDAALVMAATIVLGEQPELSAIVRQELKLASVDSAGSDVIVKALHHYKKRLGSESAAVAALLSGENSIARALDRSRSSGLSAPDRFATFGRYLAPAERMALAPQVNQILALAIAHRLGWPVPPNTRVSSPFGERIHPITKKRSMHTGIDLPVPRGTELRASADGIVRYAGRDGINGRYLKIDHGYGLATVMCHNSKNLFSTGDAIGRNATVALSGSSGRSTGPHVHFGVKVGKKFVDPLPLLRFGDMKASCISRPAWVTVGSGLHHTGAGK
jgi:murein DD-endopeptidase MepM/ murein hydrolase activator NlpD